MPFMVPFLPAIFGGLAAGGSGALVTGLMNRGRSKGGTSGYSQGGAPWQELQLMNERRLASVQGREFGERFMPVDYYSGLLSGNRAQITNLLAPETQAIMRNYQTALTSARELMPRSGASSTLAGELPFRAAGDISNLISGVRPMAANQLSTLGTNMANLGVNVGGTVSNLFGNVGTGGQNLLPYETARRAQNIDLGGGIGGWLFDNLKGVDWSKVGGTVSGWFGGGGPDLTGFDPGPIQQLPIGERGGPGYGPFQSNKYGW
jgi:hypothetical protein